MKKICLVFLIGIALSLSSFTPRELTWVAIGDSITYLNDHPDETGNRITKGYMSRISEKFKGLKYINQGHNGWRSTDIAERIESLGIVKADFYTIFLGTNDWWSEKPVGTIADYKKGNGFGTLNGSFRIIIDKIRSLNKDAKIVLMTPMQRNDFVYLFEQQNNAYGSYKLKNGVSLEAYANAIISIGKEEKIEVVDLYHEPKLDLKLATHFKRLKNPSTGEYQNYKYPDWTQIPFQPTDEYPYPVESINTTYDGLHPSDKGYEIITEKLVKAFRKLDKSFQ